MEQHNVNPTWVKLIIIFTHKVQIVLTTKHIIFRGKLIMLNRALPTDNCDDSDHKLLIPVRVAKYQSM